MSENSTRSLTIKKTIKRLLPWQITEAIVFVKYLGKRLPNRECYIRHVENKSGIEIGGPSTVFKGVLPLYSCIRELDGVNFSSDTVWEGSIKPGQSYNYYANKKGRQFIADATDLSQIADGSYDFILSSNCLEHVANPIKSLIEWKRLLRPRGFLILVVPNKASNFDHKRSVTSFEHIIDDFDHGILEDDLTHLDEILAYHDLSRDPRAGTLSAFRTRSMNNYYNRTLHHHVFDLKLIADILNFAQFDVVATTESKFDFFALATKRS